MANLSITTAWEEAAGFVKREARLLLPIVFLLVSLPLAMMQALEPPAPAPGATPEPGAWMLMLPVAIVTGLIGSLAVMHLALTPGASVGEALQRAARRFLSLLAAMLLLLLAGVVLFLIAATIAMVVVPGGLQAVASGVQSEATERVAVVAMLILLPPIAFFGTRLLLISPVAAAENGGPFALLARSWRLTGPCFWRLLGFLLLIMLVWMVLAIAIGSVLGILIVFSAGEIRPGSAAMLLTILVTAVLDSVIGVYFYSLVARIYAQLAA